MIDIKNIDEEGLERVNKVLQSQIESAETDEVIAICVTTINKDGQVQWQKGGSSSDATMIGALEITKMFIIRDID